MQVDTLEWVGNALEDLKAQDIITITVSELTSITDVMIFCSGTSTRHVKSIASNLIKQAKEHQVRILGVEGENEGEWVLVDLGDLIIHVMLPTTREFYQLEKLWGIATENESDENQAHNHRR